MWISRKKYEEMERRIRRLEDATRCLRAPHGAKLGRVVDLLLDHLGVKVSRQLEHDYIAKKGGPERG